MTGGHWYDNGTGPVRLDPPAETPADTALTAYLDHAHGCAECHRRLHNCETGAALWAAYTAARGPLMHPAAWAAS